MKVIQQQNSDKIVFLDNISIISLDVNRCRLVFNFMNNIHMFGRWTPDYHYFSYDTLKEAEEAFDVIKSLPEFRLNFFISECPENLHIINKKAITTMSIKDEELKIIFNLNFSVTSYKDNSPVEISKFIFWNYEDEDDFDTDRLEIGEQISSKIEI